MDSTAPIYLNACSHGLPSKRTLGRMADYLHQELDVGAMRASRSHEAEVQAVRRLAAGVLNAEVARTGFGSSTTQLWTRVFGRLPARKGRILVSACEWGAYVGILQRLCDQSDLVMEVVPLDDGEAFDPAAWAGRMDEDVVAICLPLVTSVFGSVFPVEEILGVDRPERALTVVDAAQGVGRMALSGHLSACDVVVATTRKWLRGPRQTAVFSLSEGAEALLGLSVSEVEVMDCNVALRLGLGAALEAYQQAGPARVMADIQTLEAQITDGLREAGYDVLASEAKAVGTICALIPTQDAARIDGRLSAAGVVVKWPDQSRDEPLASGAESRAVLRISPHVYNTQEEVAQFLDVMRAAR